MQQCLLADYRVTICAFRESIPVSLVRRARAALPTWLKKVLRPLVRGSISVSRRAQFVLEFGFVPPPDGTDLAGYDLLLRAVRDRHLLELTGDLLEIGAFLGGGTYKLARYVERQASQKTIYVVDIFRPEVDQTCSRDGHAMSELYRRRLGQFGPTASQFEIFQKVTAGCTNVVTLRGDSWDVQLPAKALCFAFVDGNHDPAYVRNDFELAWRKLSPGGIVALDDYGHDLPGVTATIDELVREHIGEIESVWCQGKIIFIERRALLSKETNIRDVRMVGKQDLAT